MLSLASGERIHSGNKRSACGGELDVDANEQKRLESPLKIFLGGWKGACRSLSSVCSLLQEDKSDAARPQSSKSSSRWRDKTA